MTAMSTPASTRIHVRNLSMVIRIVFAHVSYRARAVPGARALVHESKAGVNGNLLPQDYNL